MIVTLQPDEIQVCQMVGRMRSLIARGNGVRDAKMGDQDGSEADVMGMICLLYTSPSPRDGLLSRMPSSA